MATGIDIAGDVRPYLGPLKAAGIDFVARYYAVHTHIPGKILTLDEAQAISAAGLNLVAVWENGLPTTPSYFTGQQGKEDASAAAQLAMQIGQPLGTPIYFAVDCDLSYVSISQQLFNYFVGIRNTLAPDAKIGVYGSGLVCEKMMDWALASYSWLARAKDWEGYKSFLPRATLVQGPLAPRLAALHMPADVTDGDLAMADDYGGFQVPFAQPPTA